MKLIDHYKLDVRWAADYVRCRVVKDIVEQIVEAKIAPREDGAGYWLEFPVEPPFTLISIEGSQL